MADKARWGGGYNIITGNTHARALALMAGNELLFQTLGPFILAFICRFLCLFVCVCRQQILPILQLNKGRNNQLLPPVVRPARLHGGVVAVS